MRSAKLFSSGSKEHNVEHRGRMRKLVKASLNREIRAKGI